MAEDFIPVKSAIRTLEVIDLLAGQPRGLTFGEVAERMSWPRSSCYNLLRTMVQTGHLEFHEAERTYHIGFRLWEAGQTFTRPRDLARLAQPYLQQVRAALDETAQLAVLDGLDNVYIAKAETDRPLRLASEVGVRLPAYATGLGKALLAGLDDQELERRLAGATLQAFTDATITSKQELRRELDQIRADGFAIDRGEYTLGVYCVAAPIRDGTGAVVAAMSATVPTARVDDNLRTAMKHHVLGQAALFSEALGHRTNPALPAQVSGQKAPRRRTGSSAGRSSLV